MEESSSACWRDTMGRFPSLLTASSAHHPCAANDGFQAASGKCGSKTAPCGVHNRTYYLHHSKTSFCWEDEKEEKAVVGGGGGLLETWAHFMKENYTQKPLAFVAFFCMTPPLIASTWKIVLENCILTFICCPTRVASTMLHDAYTRISLTNNTHHANTQNIQ
jgi:hypothetical protein